MPPRQRQETARTLEYLEDSVGNPSSYYTAYPGHSSSLPTLSSAPARRRGWTFLGIAGILIIFFGTLSLFVNTFPLHGSGTASSVDRYGYDRRDMRTREPLVSHHLNDSDNPHVVGTSS